MENPSQRRTLVFRGICSISERETRLDMGVEEWVQVCHIYSEGEEMALVGKGGRIRRRGQM